MGIFRLILTVDMVYGMRQLENFKYYVRVRSSGRREGGGEGWSRTNLISA